MTKKVYEFNNVFEWDFERYHVLRETLSPEDALKELVREQKYYEDKNKQMKQSEKSVEDIIEDIVRAEYEQF